MQNITLKTTLVLTTIIAFMITFIPAGATQAETTVFSGILSPGNAQSFTMDLNVGDTVEATLVCTDGILDPFLRVYDPSGTQIAYNDDGYTPCNSFSSSIVQFSVLVAGTYRFEANAYAGPDGEFTLTIDRTANTVNNVLTFNGVVTNGVANTHDVTLNAGDQVTATHVCSDGTLDPLLRVNDPSGTQVASNDDGYTTCNSFRSSIVTFTAQVTGNYVFEADSYGTSSGPYTLTVIISRQVTETPPSAQQATTPTDARLNPNSGDRTDVVLYPGFDEAGAPRMDAYCVDGKGDGYLGLVISQTDLPTTAPSTNTLLVESTTCQVEFWVLAAGSEYAYQINVGPNPDGTLTELLFNDISASDLVMRTFNLYDLGD